MSNKRKKKPLRNANLAVAPRAVVKESKKVEAVNNGADPFDESLKHGKNGYAFKAQQAGDYRKVGAVIKKYRQENPDSTYLDVYEVLHNRFPWIFEKTREEIKYGGNVSTFINNDTLWRNCYFINSGELIALAEIRIAEILDKDDVEDNIVISAYDKLKKYELAERQLEQGDNTSVSEETHNTFNQILSGIEELKAGV